MKEITIFAMFALFTVLQETQGGSKPVITAWPLGVAKTFEFQITDWGNDNHSPTPKFYKMLVARVKVQRPNALRFNVTERVYHQQILTGGKIEIQSSTAPDLFVTDGHKQCLYHKQTNSYSLYPGVPSLQSIVSGKRGEDLLMCSPLLFSANPLKEFGMHYNGIVTIDKIKGFSYSGSIPGTEKSALFQFILDSRTRLPLMMRGFELSPTGNKKVEIDRIYFSGWKLNKPINANIFKPKPQGGAKLLSDDSTKSP